MKNSERTRAVLDFFRNVRAPQRYCNDVNPGASLLRYLIKLMSELGIAKNIVERAVVSHLAPGDFAGEQELVIIRPRKLCSFSRLESYKLSGLAEPHEEVIPVLRRAGKAELTALPRERRTQLWVGEHAIERVAIVDRFVGSDKLLVERGRLR